MVPSQVKFLVSRLDLDFLHPSIRSNVAFNSPVTTLSPRHRHVEGSCRGRETVRFQGQYHCGDAGGFLGI